MAHSTQHKAKRHRAEPSGYYSLSPRWLKATGRVRVQTAFLPSQKEPCRHSANPQGCRIRSRADCIPRGLSTGRVRERETVFPPAVHSARVFTGQRAGTRRLLGNTALAIPAMRWHIPQRTAATADCTKYSAADVLGLRPGGQRELKTRRVTKHSERQTHATGTYQHRRTPVESGVDRRVWSMYGNGRLNVSVGRASEPFTYSNKIEYHHKLHVHLSLQVNPS
mgnify:CR=1 FL=1